MCWTRRIGSKLASGTTPRRRVPTSCPRQAASRVQPFLGRQQAACPGQYALAGLGEAFEALAASHQFQAEFFLQAAQAHGQGRLGDVAARGGLAEVAGFVEGAEEFQLLDVHRRFRGGGVAES